MSRKYAMGFPRGTGLGSELKWHLSPNLLVVAVG